MLPDKNFKALYLWMPLVFGIALGAGVAFLYLAKPARTRSVFEKANPPQNPLTSGNSSNHSSDNLSVSLSQPSTHYQTYDLPQATVHVVSVDVGVPVAIATTPNLATVTDFAQQNNALAVINGGFFDPQNGKTTSHLISQGQSVGDPANNERLTGNPNLQAYLPQILNRSEFRVYRCQGLAQGLDPGSAQIRYDIAPHDAVSPSGCETETALGAGPQLLPKDTAFTEAFTDYENGDENGTLIRDAIGSVQPNARSALAIRPDGTLLLIMVSQRTNLPNDQANDQATSQANSQIATGMTLADLTEFATSLGATQLLNLDGGSSSSLYYDGQTYLGKLDAEGQPVQRPVKSVIMIRRNQDATTP